jgi:nucleoside-diphosphate-sugar epimerase
MRVLLLGGTRFIGPSLARLLDGAGHAVAVFHRGQTQADLPASVVHLLGDRRNLSVYRPALVRFTPDVVIDLLAMTEQDARTVVEMFEGIVPRLVVLSSMDVYRAYDRFRGVVTGAPDPVPLAEDAPLRQTRFPYRNQAHGEDDLLYHYEKILVEQVVLGQSDLQGTVLRLPCVYGPRDYQHRIFPYLKRMDDGRPAILLGERQAAWRWSRGYLEDVAAAIACAATDERAVGQIYNIGEFEALTEAAWVRRIALAVGWAGTVRTIPEEQLPDSLRTPFDWRHSIVGDTSKIRRELGYREGVPTAEAMAHTIAWERRYPPSQAQQFDYRTEDEVLAQLA